MTDAALALEEGQVSEPIDVVSDVENSYYVIYRSFKSDEHFDANYDEIKYVYLMNYVGKISHGIADELKSSVAYTDVLETLDYSTVGM